MDRNYMGIRRLIVAVVISYLIMLFGGGALKPGYSHVGQFISELNATGTSYAQVIGWLGFVPFGLLTSMLIISLAGVAPVRGASRAGYWILILQPIAYIGSALAPCDIGCPVEGSMSQTIHNMLGLFTYSLTAVGLVLLSLAPRISVFMRLLWLVLAFVWLMLFTLMLDSSLEHLRGILQRLAEWIVFGVLLVCAWRLSVANKQLNSDVASGAH
ncbi:MAG: DUF998 domain-containing protein [Pseudohongiella sp.]|nr:DUF998 domain-containing protein [Pseudohongiella sp.]